jgi:hypothetical protein
MDNALGMRQTVPMLNIKQGEKVMPDFTNMTEGDAALLAVLLDRYGYLEVIHTMAVEAKISGLHRTASELAIFRSELSDVANREIGE